MTTLNAPAHALDVNVRLPSTVARSWGGATWCTARRTSADRSGYTRAAALGRAQEVLRAPAAGRSAKGGVALLRRAASSRTRTRLITTREEAPCRSSTPWGART